MSGIGSRDRILRKKMCETVTRYSHVIPHTLYQWMTHTSRSMRRLSQMAGLVEGRAGGDLAKISGYGVGACGAGSAWVVSATCLATGPKWGKCHLKSNFFRARAR